MQLDYNWIRATKLPAFATTTQQQMVVSYLALFRSNRRIENRK
jgi:hypothetical protein